MQIKRICDYADSSAIWGRLSWGTSLGDCLMATIGCDTHTHTHTTNTQTILILAVHTNFGS